MIGSARTAGRAPACARETGRLRNIRWENACARIRGWTTSGDDRNLLGGARGYHCRRADDQRCVPRWIASSVATPRRLARGLLLETESLATANMRAPARLEHVGHRKREKESKIPSIARHPPARPQEQCSLCTREDAYSFRIGRSHQRSPPPIVPMNQS
jgi:hypothetical protein